MSAWSKVRISDEDQSIRRYLSLRTNEGDRISDEDPF